MNLATQLSPLSAAAPASARPADKNGVGTIRPPRGLYLPHGTPSAVRFGDTLPPKGGRTAAQRLGLAYEQRVIDVLSSIYAARFFHSTPLLFEDRRGLHRCIPDGVLRVNDVTIVIIEIKLRHTVRAWWQLEKLYLPVLRQLAPGAQIHRAEICRSYDPAEAFPPHDVATSLHRLSSARVGVLQWKI